MVELPCCFETNNQILNADRQILIAVFRTKLRTLLSGKEKNTEG